MKVLTMKALLFWLGSSLRSVFLQLILKSVFWLMPRISAARVLFSLV